MNKKKSFLIALLSCAFLAPLGAWAHDGDHEYQNGICTVEDCTDPFQPAQKVDGYYELANAGNVEWFSKMVSLSPGEFTNACLTADIDMEGIPHRPIGGSAGDKYRGTFDGRGHRILNMTEFTSVDNVGFFGATRGESAYIKNLIIDKSCLIQGGSRVGAIVGDIQYPPSPSYTTLENCINEADVVATGSQVGGLIGGASFNDGTAYIINCINRGSVSGGSETAAFIGKTANGAVIISSYNEGFVLSGRKGTNNLVATGNVTFTNVCDISEDEGGTQGIMLPFSAKESGELCYNLNGDQSVIRWTQTVGSDEEPVVGTEHGQVYAHGKVNCDNTSAPGTIYNNEGPDGIIRLDHEFGEDGHCINCSAMDGEVTPAADGWYDISSARELRWFAYFVNQGNTSAKARLTADIDLENVSWEPIGTYGDAQSGVGIQNPYKGVFDGQNHTIYNLYIDAYDLREVGLFGRVNGGGTLRNFGVINANINTPGGRAGVVAGEIHQSTVTNVFTGGDININTIYFQWGGISGEAASSNLTNCFTTYEILTNNPGTLTNCHWGEEIAEKAESGEFCFELNNGSFINPTWYQTLGEDPCPVLNNTHGLVYTLGDGTYRSALTEEERENMVGEVIDYEANLYEEKIASVALRDNYISQIRALSGVPFEQFLQEYEKMNGIRESVRKSEEAYVAYKQKISEITTFLEENPNFGGPGRKVVEDYVGTMAEPSELYPNGTYAYIMQELVLGTADIEDEITFAQKLLDKAVAGGYKAGSEVTNLMVNADFSNQTEGWTFTKGSLNRTASLSGMKNMMGCQNSKMDIHQTVTDLLPGIYEFRINAYAEVKGLTDACAYNYGAFVYANDNVNYVHSKYTSLLDEEEVADAPSDFVETYFNYGNDFGWGPNGYNGVVRAFDKNHYVNSILVNIKEGESLNVGLTHLGSNKKLNDTFFGNARLFYWGTMDEADDALGAQLENMLSIASHIQDDYPISEPDYESAPNFYVGLMERNSKLIQKAGTNLSAEEKYQLIQDFGKLFDEIYNCKMAYIDMIALNDEIFQAACSSGTEDEIDEIALTFYEPILDGYGDCVYTQKEAESMIDAIKATTFYLRSYGREPELVDGVYMLSDPYNLSWVARKANAENQLNLNLALANDIDMSEFSNFEPIAKYYDNTNTKLAFAGTLDGRGHVIRNLTVSVTDRCETGLFSRCKGATIKNLGIVNANISNLSGVRSGALAGELYQCTITNCFVAGDLNIETDNVQAGGLAGEGAQSTFINCYTLYNKIADNTGKLDNCYAEETVTDILATGELCYKLNGDQSNIAFYQNLEEDTYPTLDSSRGRVYVVGSFTCGGDPLDEVSYSNSESGNYTQPHEYGEDGLCINCGADEGACVADANGVFHLSTPRNVRWFSSYVNGGHDRANAVLDADIDMSCFDNFTPIGLFCDALYTQAPYSLPRLTYKGHFDGQGHTISNLTVSMDKDYEVGFFSRLENAVVENLGFCNAKISSLTETNHRSGVLAGLSNTATVRNIFSIGEIVIESNSNVGGIVGSKSNGTVTSCFTTYDVVSSEGSVSYCFAGIDVEEKAASGELCFLLNKSTSQNPVWYQNIGTDPYPVLDATHKVVYLLEDGSYSNSQSELAKYEGTAADPIIVKNAGELAMLRTVLKAGRVNYIELNADIDMSNISEWTPLNTTGDTFEGKDYMNWIHFDGNGHTISNFNSTDPSVRFNSFFGVLCGGVRNVKFENACVVSGVNGSGILASWIGHGNYTEGTTLIENVAIEGDLTVTAEYCGGMAGNIGGATMIKNAYVNAEIHSTLAMTAGLIGRVRGQLNVQNCYVAGTCQTGGGLIGGGQDGSTPAATYNNIVVWNNDYEYFGTMAKSDKRSNVKFYNGQNFEDLQKFVVSWDNTKWSAKDGEYPELILSSEKDDDAIHGVIADNDQLTKDNRIFNLAGQRMSKMHKGINIVGGKKVLF